MSKHLSSAVAWTWVAHVLWWIRPLAKKEERFWETWKGQQMRNLASEDAWCWLRDDRLWNQKEETLGRCCTDGRIQEELPGEERMWSKQYSGWMDISGKKWCSSRAEKRSLQYKGWVVWTGGRREAAGGYVWGNLPVLGRPRGWSGSFLASLLKSSSFLGFISPLKGIPSLGHELPICSLKICSKIAQSLKFTFGLQVYAFAGGYCSALVLHGFFIFLLLGVQSAPQLSCPAFSLYTTQMTTIWQQIWDIFFYLFSSLSFLDFNMYFIFFFFAAKCRK